MGDQAGLDGIPAAVVGHVEGNDDNHFQYLSQAWGPDRFHTLLAQFVGQAAEAASAESSPQQHHHRKASSLLLGYDDQLAAYTLDYFLGIDGEEDLDDQLAADILDQDFFDMESLTSGEESSSSEEEDESYYYHTTCCQACSEPMLEK